MAVRSGDSVERLHLNPVSGGLPTRRYAGFSSHHGWRSSLGRFDVERAVGCQMAFSTFIAEDFQETA
jgi:hypothetical protein